MMSSQALEQPLEHVRKESESMSLKEQVVEKTADVMWSSGYPATHSLISLMSRKASWSENRKLWTVLLAAAAFEIVEELF